MKKTALITGASGGIGSAAALKLAEDGYDLYLHGNTGKEKLKELKEACSMAGNDVLTIEADLSGKEGNEKLLASINRPIDLLLLNSGMSYYGLMTDIEEEDMEKMIYLGVTSPYKLARQLVPGMIQRKSGCILVITSIWGITGASCEVLYSMVKGGQNTFVKALAKELAPSGIRVNGIAPGAVKTNMLNDFTEEELEALENEIPAGRLAEPEEIAESVRFLASNKASYINGQILSVNGGWHC
ncbi:SDR family oxidoreductase [Metabacillus sp. GX 13764]|uniref:elongation factor P 5-aminopentanone reductase n=1 Tax=Metabacillus kandeliae TaxID=2900151 RepID=UPI001E2F359F|nr:SDR family oxidoreductase [Metabacillus kandeliae]MCD7033710.1 SDR family oxidoreductase [Metabacillus kandeliae]